MLTIKETIPNCQFLVTITFLRYRFRKILNNQLQNLSYFYTIQTINDEQESYLNDFRWLGNYPRS